MTTISVYNYTAEKLEKIAEKLDTTVAEIIDELLEDSEDEDFK